MILSRRGARATILLPAMLALACTSSKAPTLVAFTKGDLSFTVPSGWTQKNEKIGEENAALEFISLSPAGDRPREESYRIGLFLLRTRGRSIQEDAVRQGLKQAQGTTWSEKKQTFNGGSFTVFDVTLDPPCPSARTAACIQRIYVGVIGSHEVQINFVAATRALFDANLAAAEQTITSLRAG